MDHTALYDKIYACWLGKNIGGTLGTPVEGRMEVMDLTWYPVLNPNGALPNDDLDLQLLNLHAIEMHGTHLTADDIASEWSEHCFFPFDEYGYASTAMRYGFKPPFSGMFDNHFTNCMGSPIRSEIWAAIAAGNPHMAAYFAWQDAVVDHAGGEGVFGEIFNAAFEAAAYESTDIPALICEALTYIPDTSRVYGAVSLLLELYETGTELLEARKLILERFGSHNFTDAPQNIAFGLAGLLWGKNFEDAILKVVNLGYDTDCTVATCGAMWGILYGREGIDSKWSEPIGDSIQMSPAVRGFRAPADLDELTHRCLVFYDKLCLEDADTYVITEKDNLYFAVQHYTLPADSLPNEAFCVDVYYENDDPIIAPERDQTLKVTFTNNTTWPWNLKASIVCPYGLVANAPEHIIVSPGKSVVYSPTVKIDTSAVDAIPEDRVYSTLLSIKRLNCGDCWKVYHLPVTLLAPNRWTLNGKSTLISGATVTFDELNADGVYIAESNLCTPSVSRETRLNCNCHWPTTVELDGKVIVHTEALSLFIPAYHRTPEEQRWEGLLESGTHKVKVTIRMPENARKTLPTFVMSVNSTMKVSEPGWVYAYIDDHFAR